MREMFELALFKSTLLAARQRLALRASEPPNAGVKPKRRPVARLAKVQQCEGQQSHCCDRTCDRQPHHPTIRPHPARSQRLQGDPCGQRITRGKAVLFSNQKPVAGRGARQRASCTSGSPGYGGWATHRWRKDQRACQCFIPARPCAPDVGPASRRAFSLALRLAGSPFPGR